jgi:hypothetical protein
MPGDLLGELGKPRIGNDHRVDEKQSGGQGNFRWSCREFGSNWPEEVSNLGPILLTSQIQLSFLKNLALKLS